MFIVNKILDTNRIFVINEDNDIKSDNELIEKSVKSKTWKLYKLIKKLSKFKELLILKYTYIF